MRESEQQVPPPPQAIAHQWLSRFERCIRARDYSAADLLCHQKCAGFGLEKNYLDDITSWESDWREVWPNQIAFTFDIAQARVSPNGTSIVIALPWVTQSTIAGAPPKRGRATIVLVCYEDGKVLAVHLHFSRNVE